MTTRADYIFDILESEWGRLQVSTILQKLAVKESVDLSDLNQSVVSATVRQDNRLRSIRGKAKRFKFLGDGDEERGFVSIIQHVSVATSKKQILENPSNQIPALIEAANGKVKEQLKAAISRLSW